ACPARDEVLLPEGSSELRERAIEPGFDRQSGHCERVDLAYGECRLQRRDELRAAFRICGEHPAGNDLEDPKRRREDRYVADARLEAAGLHATGGRRDELAVAGDEQCKRMAELRARPRRGEEQRMLGLLSGPRDRPPAWLELLELCNRPHDLDAVRHVVRPRSQRTISP